MDAKKLYTKSGDGGYTKTLKNVRISKADAVIEFIGSLEEAYAEAVNVKVHSGDTDAAGLAAKINIIRREALGEGVFITAESIAALEAAIDETGVSDVSEFEPGNELSAGMLKVYAVLRRAERAAVKAGQFGRYSKNVLAYMNRICTYAAAVAKKLDSDGAAPVKTAKLTAAEKITVDTDVVKMKLPSEAKKVLTLSLAKEIALAIEHLAAGRGKNIVVAILDEGTNPILVHAMDNSFIASVQIALDKAYTAASLKMPTHEALELSKEGGALWGLTNGGRILMLGGGYPLMLGDRLCGGIAVSGSTAEEDTEFAAFGAKYFEMKFSE